MLNTWPRECCAGEQEKVPNANNPTYIYNEITACLDVVSTACPQFQFSADERA